MAVTQNSLTGLEQGWMGILMSTCSCQRIQQELQALCISHYGLHCQVRAFRLTQGYFTMLNHLSDKSLHQETQEQSAACHLWPSVPSPPVSEAFHVLRRLDHIQSSQNPFPN